MRGLIIEDCSSIEDENGDINGMWGCADSQSAKTQMMRRVRPGPDRWSLINVSHSGIEGNSTNLLKRSISVLKVLRKTRGVFL